MKKLKIEVENLSKKERKQLLALIEKATKPKEELFWSPKIKEKYFYITGRNEVFDAECYSLLTNFNYYKTLVEAQKVADYFKKSEWFVRKAHEFKKKKGSWLVVYNYAKKEWSVVNGCYVGVETITMYVDDAIKFKCWLNKYAPQGFLAYGAIPLKEGEI